MEDHELDPTSIDLDSEYVEQDIGDITTTPLRHFVIQVGENKANK